MDNKFEEKVYGDVATVFHRTSVSDLINRVFTEGFKPGNGDFYGKACYTTYEFASQTKEDMSEKYGNIVVKFAAHISNFFIFDYKEFAKTSLFKKLGSPSRMSFLKEQFEYFKIDPKNFNFREWPMYTSKQARWCYRNLPDFTSKVDGIIFTGEQDGKVLAAYNTKVLIPIAYTSDDGETWHPVEKNKPYIQKSLGSHNAFRRGLKRKITPEEVGITDYTFDENGYLNVNGHVVFSEAPFEEIPFKFGVVTGSFVYDFGLITSLKNAPYKVGGNFAVTNCRLLTLEGGPKQVGGNYDCSNNYDLASLEGAPSEIAQSFSAITTSITSLKGAPRYVGKSFNVDNCTELVSLEGAPQFIGENFSCTYTSLTSLRGGPKQVEGHYFCNHVPLKSLEGAPEIIKQNFVCSDTLLTSFRGAPKEIHGYLIADNLPKLRSLAGFPKFIGEGIYLRNALKYVPSEQLKNLPSNAIISSKVK